jgi:hypothetical protein
MTLMTNTITTLPPSRLQAALSKISLITGVLYVAILVLLHVLEPEFDPTWRFISEYALGKFGLLMNITFAAYAVSHVCSGIAIYSQVKTIVGYIGLGLLAISAAGILIAAIFNTDPVTTDQTSATLSGQMHYMGAALDFSPLAMLLLAFALKKNQAWKPIQNRLFFAAAVSILLTVLFMVSMPHDYQFKGGVYTGLIGRFLFVSNVIWLVVVNRQVRKLSSKKS